ncbi:protein of unknown function DUF1697 [Kipferlia bialata]|uniref:DUF1697 domain-containing protein n=1 Tax=Kipferlia bialata TaxID=797122 RepID=A0A9K3GKG4_9EUKA|nr:protein of unknown function DUF1697 [Kipferlia bialata]|eukprot:g7990.t1
MLTWVALLRGINVGGHKKILMQGLRDAITSNLGYDDVRTYIQSGNIVFRTEDSLTEADVTTSLSDMIEREYGYTVAVLVLSIRDVKSALSANLYGTDRVHLMFCRTRPTPSAIQRVEARKAPSESISVIGSVAYIHTPDGLATSNMARAIPKDMGVDVTARNTRSVSKIITLAEEVEGGVEKETKGRGKGKGKARKAKGAGK